MFFCGFFLIFCFLISFFRRSGGNLGKTGFAVFGAFVFYVVTLWQVVSLYEMTVQGLMLRPFTIVFAIITVLTLLFCLAYNVADLLIFSVFLGLIGGIGLGLFFSANIFLFFFYYECLLLPSFFVLYYYAKTRACIEAAYQMFFWTQFGAMFLFFSFFYLFLSEHVGTFADLADLSLGSFEGQALFWL